MVVDKDSYFLEVCRYVDLNPVRAKMVKRPHDWPWSSYCAHAARVDGPAWLDSQALHQRLAPRAPRRDGPDAYARFVAQGRGIKLWEEALSGQIFLGDEAFVKRMQARISNLGEREIPRVQRRPVTQALGHYFKDSPRDVAIARAYLEGGHTQTAIARATGLSVSRVSRLIARREAKGKT